MDEQKYLESKFNELNCCVLIPTYNNDQTLEKVINSILALTNQVIIVNDGATDSTLQILEKYPHLLVYSHSTNLGKGMSLRNGFQYALQKGYKNCITIDSDGQHKAEDLHKFLLAAEKQPGSIIMGARNMNQDSVPSKSSFGHKFSNFWFRFETGVSLPDTQTGYRLNPLSGISDISFFTNKFEFEIEVIVKSAWKGIPIISVPVDVYYAPKEKRISHFRPFQDFTRVSLLNIYFVVLSLFWHIPWRLLKKLTLKNMKTFFKEQFMNPSESPMQKSIAIAFGVFMGIIPIWGFQLIVGLTICYFLKINKALFVTAAHISIAPMIPFVIYMSFTTGGWVLKEPSSLKEFTSFISLKAIQQNVYQYVVGSVVLAIISGFIAGLVSYACFLSFRSDK